jgi:hypothetical protein
MEPELADGWVVRGEALPLPDRDAKYTRVLVCGSTGAGKTTVVRQLIGSDPDKDRFPSTSTAKTTVADMEIILRDGPNYQAAVTFLPRDRVRAYIEECVIAAIGAAAEGAEDARIVARLLEHSEQRFRLAYLLGTLAPERDEAVDDWGDVATPSVETDQRTVSHEERQALQTKLRAFRDRCKVVGFGLRDALAKALTADAGKVSGTEKDAFLELLEEEASRRENAYFNDIQAIIDDIMEDVESRFELLQGGRIDRTRSGWPRLWVFESADRALFLRHVNRLTSNYAPNFGRLLTPIVQGIRIAGPLTPSWLGDNASPPRLVLLDGEGLGHTTDSTISLPTTMTRRFSDVDVIALVDSATQPMLAGPSAVLRAASSMGHDKKLMVLFTHFDEVRGDNLPTKTAKQEHVRNSLDNVANGLESVLGSTTVRGLRRNLDDKVFFLASVDRRLDLLNKPPMRKHSEDELRRFLVACEKAIEPPVPVEAHPVYDLANLVLALAGATSRFQRAWSGRLGVEVRPGVRPEHWMRVKALSRRFAEWGEDQFDNMMPVADLLRELTEGLAVFLSNPRAWEPDGAPEELKQAALEAVRQAVSAQLHDLASLRLRTGPLVAWRRAFQVSGQGSGRQRARGIWEIYTDAAPRVTEIPTPEGVSFLDAVRDLFRNAVLQAGGRVV